MLKCKNILTKYGSFLGLLLNLGFWSLSYEPIHLAEFAIVCCLIPLLAYTACILQALYNTLQEAYIDVSKSN